MKLNLGCGTDKRDGFVNSDRSDQDLNSFPYRWEDCSADEIVMSHVLEHLLFPERVMEECWRILKPGGKLKVTGPWYKSIDAFADLEHLHFYNDRSMYTFEHPEHNPQTHAHFKVVGVSHVKNPSWLFKIVPLKYRNWVFNLCLSVTWDMVKVDEEVGK